MNDEDHVLLSEKLEDQLKAVEWAHEQKKILDDKSRRIADALVEKMTPLIMKNSVQKQRGYNLGTLEMQLYKRYAKLHQNDTV